MESINQFEKRKIDHLKISLDPRVQAEGLSRFESIQLIHEALPEINFNEVSTEIKSLNSNFSAPLFISSMTAGSEASIEINSKLASFCEKNNLLMGVGSQRRQLIEGKSSGLDSMNEWKVIRKQSPKVKLASNIGLAQLIETPIDEIKKIIDSIEAVVLFVHLNPLQECIQLEGTPQFKGGLAAIKNVAKKLNVPVVVKEVGCGISKSVFLRLADTEIYAVDVAGLGGTHWGRIEGYRHQARFEISETFKNWGIPTVDSLLMAKKEKLPYKVWSSGGVRSGLDIAKSIVLGAEMVGMAKPWLEAAKSSDDKALDKYYEKILSELKISMFCTGSRNMTDLSKKEWVWLNS